MCSVVSIALGTKEINYLLI